MKIISFFIIIFLGSLCNAQNVIFNSSGRAKTSTLFQNKTSAEIYSGIKKFIVKYYGRDEETVFIDSINKRFKVNGIMNNALNRKLLPERIPNVSSIYEMDIQLINQTAEITLQHKRFVENNNEYYIDFKNLHNKERNILIYENEYNFFCEQFEGLINSINYAVETDTLINLFGNNFDYSLYIKNLLQFDSEGIAKTSLKYLGEKSALYDQSMNFLNKYFVKPNMESDEVEKTITIYGKIYDVFNRRIYFSPKKPIINTSYVIKLTFDDNQINFLIQHIKFENANWENINLNFKDFNINNVHFNNTEKERKYFIKNYNALINALIYYLDKGEMHL